MQQSLIKVRPLSGGEVELTYIDSFSDVKDKDQVAQIMVIDIVDLRKIANLLLNEARKVGE